MSTLQLTYPKCITIGIVQIFGTLAYEMIPSGIDVYLFMSFTFHLKS